MSSFYLECHKGTSNKFWEIVVDKTNVTVTKFGRLGTAGTSRTMTHNDSSAAEAYASSMVAAKLKKGYKVAARPGSAASKKPTGTITTSHKTGRKARRGGGGGAGGGAGAGAGAGTAALHRRLECTTAGHNKFWEVQVKGKTSRVTFGRIGSGGSVQTKTYSSRAAALAALEKLIAQKLHKGYVDVDDNSGASEASSEEEEEESEEEQEEDEDDDGDGLDVYMEMKSGGHSKFWRIATDGCDATVSYGKIGNKGVSKTKTFPNESKLEAHCKKLIDEKKSKGYKIVSAKHDSSDESSADDDDDDDGDGDDDGDADMTAAAKLPVVQAWRVAKANKKKGGADEEEIDFIVRGQYLVVTDDDDNTEVSSHGTIQAARQAAIKAIKAKRAQGFYVGISPHTAGDVGSSGKAKKVKRATKKNTTRRKRARGGGSDSDDDSGAAPKKATRVAKAQTAKGAQPLAGMVFCITGTCTRLRRLVVAEIEAAGGAVSKGVQKKTTHLLLAPGGHGTTKHEAAKGRGIPCVNEAWVEAKIAAGGGGGGGGAASESEEEEEEEEEEEDDEEVAADGDGEFGFGDEEGFGKGARSLVALQEDGMPKLLGDLYKKRCRTALGPVTKEVGCGELDDKFSGTPFMMPGEPWPSCKVCNKAMSFVCQYDLGKLPRAGIRKALGKGLFQFWVCDELCGYDGEPTYYQARIVKSPKLKKGSTSTGPSLGKEQKILAWRARKDVPNTEELRSMHTDPQVEEAIDSYDALDDVRPIASEKVFGWPDWCQGMEYTNCPVCNKLMTNIVFQFTGQHFGDFIIGDCGTGHVLQCNSHKDQLKFAWACC